jgi:hypothetical protein
MAKAIEQKRDKWVSITDLAIQTKTTYANCRDRVTRGEYGQVIRLGNRLFVPDPNLKPAA